MAAIDRMGIFMSQDDLAKRDDAPAPAAKNGQPDTERGPISDPSSGRRRPFRSRLRTIMLGVLIGSMIGLVGTIGLIVFLNRGQLPLMRPGDLEAAESRWKQRGPTNYNMDLEGSFDIKGHMHVEVRNREVTAMSLDGRPSASRLWHLWSVSGLFEFIEADVKRNVEAANHEGGALPEPVLQQAEFDRELGLPRGYQRTEVSTGQSGGWRIVKFEPLG
jgi:Family of unknown function (DUF6174)